MRYQLDPFALSGLAVLEERPVIRQSAGFAVPGRDGRIQSIVAGTNVTVNSSDPANPIISASGGGGGSGITRTIASFSMATAAGSTASVDYLYIGTGTNTLTLPTAVSNTNAYGIKNSGTGIITVATTSAQTIDNLSTVDLTPRQFITVYSDNSNWVIGA